MPRPLANEARQSGADLAQLGFVVSCRQVVLVMRGSSTKMQNLSNVPKMIADLKHSLHQSRDSGFTGLGYAQVPACASIQKMPLPANLTRTLNITNWGDTRCADGP